MSNFRKMALQWLWTARGGGGGVTSIDWDMGCAIF